MNATHCISGSIRLRAIGKAPVSVFLPGESMPCAAIHEHEENFTGLLIGNNWMVIHHRGKLVGRPLSGATNSWFTSWENASIEIEVCCQGVWVELEDWDSFFTERKGS